MKFFPGCLFTIVGVASAAVQLDQKLLGPAYPAPTAVADDNTIHTATELVQRTLQKALRTGISKFGNFTKNDNSLSITAASCLDDKPFLDFQFTPQNLNTSAGSTARVTGDSVYRIGSISKLFTVYTLLLNHGFEHWDKPVTDYIPELKRDASQPGHRDAIDHVQWDQVTVGALASQLSGIGRDGML